MDTDIKTAEAALEPLFADVCRPLTHLREDISSTVIQEYQPTGDTPQKLTYEYPTELPRTQAHASLLAKFHGEPSPSKATVFVDADPTLSENRSPSRPVSNDEFAPLADRGPNPLTAGLRELHPNVNSNTGISGFDKRASAALHGFGAGGGPGSLMGVEDDVPEDMTMPLFKRSRTTRGRTGKKTLSITSVEGRENLPHLATIVPGGGKEIFSQSITRRKSPRLN
jgi:kinesin family protein 11